VQFTLGENSGLRGYDARYFEGDRRLRINFEDRIFTPLELFTLHLGVVAFFEAGYAWESSQGFQWDDLKTSAGFGFRIGSARIFQGSVLRIDVAFPFDEEGSDGVSVSVTTGQVFTLYSNPDKLTLRW
jgi:hemolysin activation/secretion protein